MEVRASDELDDGAEASRSATTPRIPFAGFSVSGRLMKDHIFDNISPHEALEIIRQLAETDKRLKKKITELAEI